MASKKNNKNNATPKAPWGKLTPEKKRMLLLGSASAFFGLVALAVGVFWLPDSNRPRITPQTVAQGKALFQANCAVCHGEEGIGQDPANPKGGMSNDGKFVAPSMDKNGHAFHHPESALFETIKNGSMASDSPMRGWANRLKDEEIWALIDYIESLWPPELLQFYRANISTKS